MSERRRFEVSFKAELDDHECDQLADTLFELGYDDIAFRPLAEALAPGGTAGPAVRAPTRRTEGASTPEAGAKYCPECGERYWSWGSHAERCFGPPVGVRGRGGEKEDL